MPGIVLMHDLRQRQQRAGVAGGDHARRLAAATASIATRIEAPRMRSAALGLMSLPMTSGAWRTVQAPVRPLDAREQRRQPRLIAHQQEARGRMPLRRDVQALDNHVGRMVARPSRPPPG